MTGPVPWRSTTIGGNAGKALALEIFHDVAIVAIDQLIEKMMRIMDRFTSKLKQSTDSWARITSQVASGGCICEFGAKEMLRFCHQVASAYFLRQSFSQII